MSALLDVAEAQRKLLSAIEPLPTEWVELERAANRILAVPIPSAYDLPLFDNSSMDGYAVQAGDTHTASSDTPVLLHVVADIPAGQARAVEIHAGQAARIMTGAPLPAGADAIVISEDTDTHQRHPANPLPEVVSVYKRVLPGENIRRRGTDVRARDVVMGNGKKLNAQDIGFLAMLGTRLVQVHRRPKLALFSSGDELLPVDAQLSAGKIHDSNSYMLRAMIQQCGAEVIWLGIARDDEQAVQEKLDAACSAGADLILSSAGVSVGAFDYIKNVVAKGGEIAFWKVNMRPGKPLAFGRYRGFPFIGLPGNPVSAFVGFEVFVRPALAKMQGQTGDQRHRQLAILEEAVESDGRESYLRAIVRKDGAQLRATLTGHQGSGNLHSLVQANALLLIPSGVKSLPIGSQVEVWLFE